jgi:hypothetical protein
MAADTLSKIFSCPEGYLTRAEVFKQAFERLTAGCLVRLDASITCTVHDDGETFIPDADEADRRFADSDAYDAHRWSVARRLGDAVADGRLPPYIRGPNGQMESARKGDPDDPEEWRREFDNFADDFSSIWLDTGDQHVFWKISDFEAWLASELGVETAAIGKRRRKPGPMPDTTKRWIEDDRALFDDVESLVKGGLTLTAATQKLANEGRVKGTGIAESRAKRLAKRHKAERGS